MNPFREDRLAGTLLGAAIGDPGGVAAAHGALIASSLSRSAYGDVDAVTARFRAALFAWSLRHPWIADAGTMHACGCIALGLRRTGARGPAANPAARTAIVGARFADDAELRHEATRALADVTHSDERAIEAALFVADVAAACVTSAANRDRMLMLDRARTIVRAPDLVVQLHYALELADKKVTMELAGRELGTGNSAMEAVPLATFAFARFGDSARTALGLLSSAAGKNAHSSLAIVGAWVGTLLGAACLPWELIASQVDGEFGATRLRALARDLAQLSYQDHTLEGDFSARVPSSVGTPGILHRVAMRQITRPVTRQVTRWPHGRSSSGRRVP